MLPQEGRAPTPSIVVADIGATVPVSLAAQSIIRSGPLKKHSRNITGVWQVRYVVLEGAPTHVICYYYASAASEVSASRPRGVVPLNEISVQHSGKDRMTFRVQAPSRAYELRAQTVAEAESWISCIKDAAMAARLARGHPHQGVHRPQPASTASVKLLSEPALWNRAAGSDKPASAAAAAAPAVRPNLMPGGGAGRLGQQLGKAIAKRIGAGGGGPIAPPMLTKTLSDSWMDITPSGANEPAYVPSQSSRPRDKVSTATAAQVQGGGGGASGHAHALGSRSGSGGLVELPDDHGEVASGGCVALSTTL